MEELINKVNQMRFWQKEYAKTKKFHAKDKANKLEREVDYLLTTVNKD